MKIVEMQPAWQMMMRTAGWISSTQGAQRRNLCWWSVRDKDMEEQFRTGEICGISAAAGARVRGSGGNEFRQPFGRLNNDEER
jgi:hypothetical protein